MLKTRRVLMQFVPQFRLRRLQTVLLAGLGALAFAHAAQTAPIPSPSEPFASSSLMTT